MTGVTHPDKPVHLSENHLRGVSTTLALLDELLCVVEDWASGRERQGTLYRERNSLDAAQREELLQRSAGLRRVVQEARQDMNLSQYTRDAATDIWSRCAVFRESIMELTGAQLRRYGPLSSDAESYMDHLSHRLLTGLDGLLQSVTRQRSVS
ncbi:MAG TPA: hypothetical protein P5137_01780 [Candidatus Brocadiia bacterium]|nr:hypothetical protein [Candidatus Brocadiia bacterium]